MEFLCVKEEGKINAWMLVREGKMQKLLQKKQRETERDITLTAVWLVESSFGIMAELTFNVDHGYLEGLVRGMKAGILTRTDYHNLAQCDTLEGKNTGSNYHFWTVSYLQLHPLVF